MPDPVSLPLTLPFDEAIAAAVARKVMLPEDYYGQAAEGARRAATTVSGLTGLDQIQAVIDSLTEAMRNGESLKEWQGAAIEREWGLSKGRLSTIFRTNVQTAYTSGHWRSFEANRKRRPYLMWSAINDSRVRPAHLAMDGHIAPIDDPIWRVWHPPAGYNCRCSQISLTETQARDRGYGKQSVPNARPDPGFEDGAPGDLLSILGAAAAKKLAAANARAAAAVQTRARAMEQPGPRGDPISKALKLPTGKLSTAGEIRAAMDLIDSAHGDGKLPQIPVNVSSTHGTLGTYSAYRSGDEAAVGIAVSRYGIRPRTTFAHEVGHFLDHKGWGGRGFSSANEAAAAEWLRAVRESPTVVRLTKLKSLNPRHVQYLLSPHELWARSYAQWVGTKTADPAMARELTHVKTAANPLLNLSQWDTIEFKPIAKAIDNLFTLLGWHKTP